MTRQELTWDEYGNPVIIEVDENDNIIESDEFLDKLK